MFNKVLKLLAIFVQGKHKQGSTNFFLLQKILISMFRIIIYRVIIQTNTYMISNKELILAQQFHFFFLFKIFSIYKLRLIIIIAKKSQKIFFFSTLSLYKFRITNISQKIFYLLISFLIQNFFLNKNEMLNYFQKIILKLSR